MINQIMFYGGMGCAIAFGITTVVLFIIFNVPRIVGDLTGVNAKRAINKLNSQRMENNADNVLKFSGSGRLNNQHNRITEKIKTSETSKQVGEETTLLGGQTERLSEEIGETTVLEVKECTINFRLVVNDMHISATPI